MLADEFRFAVESKRFPQLTSGLEPGSFFTQDDVKALECERTTGETVAKVTLASVSKFAQGYLLDA